MLRQQVDWGAPLVPQFAILTATFVGFATTNAQVYALLADRLSARIKRPSTLRWLNRGSRGALIGMGVLTATTQRH